MNGPSVTIWSVIQDLVTYVVIFKQNFFENLKSAFRDFENIFENEVIYLAVTVIQLQQVFINK